MNSTETASYKNLQTKALEYYKLGNYRGAAALFDRELSNGGADPWFMHDRARNLLELGGPNAVRASSDLQILVDRSPQDAQLNVSLAIAYGRAGDYGKCREYYDKAAILGPDNYEVKMIGPFDQPAHVRAHSLHDAGLKLLKANNPREALRFYEAAIALGGEKATAWSLHDKGIALMKLGLYEEARQTLLRIRELLPESAEVINNDITNLNERLTAYRMRRRINFGVTEPVIYEQQYSENRGRQPTFEGRRAESCTIASAIMVLARMGVIPQDKRVMQQLENEILRNAIKNGYVYENGAMSVDLTNQIFYDFGLQSGYTNEMYAMMAALKAGGCVCPCDGHMRSVTELSANNGHVKIFDPLYADQSAIITMDEFRTKARGNTIVVYPQGYLPSLTRNERFTSRQYFPENYLVSSPEKYIIY